MDHQETARAVADRLQASAGDAIDRIILYGSVARGHPGPDSDVDLIVVTDDYRRIHEALLEILADLALQDAPLVSTMIFTPDQFARFPQLPTSFHHHVLTEGVDLVA